MLHHLLPIPNPHHPLHPHPLPLLQLRFLPDPTRRPHRPPLRRRPFVYSSRHPHGGVAGACDDGGRRNGDGRSRWAGKAYCEERGGVEAGRDGEGVVGDGDSEGEREEDVSASAVMQM